MKISAENGVVTSPNYPEKYPSNVICRYEIAVPGDQFVKLTFKDLNTESKSRFYLCDFGLVVSVQSGFSSPGISLVIE